MTDDEKSSSSSNSSSDCDEQSIVPLVTNVIFPAVFASLHVAQREQLFKRKHGGSRPGRKPNRNIGMRQGAWQIEQDFFLSPSKRNEAVPGIYGPVFNDFEFERRYRMSKSLYEVVRAGVLETDDYFEVRADATGKIGASTDQKILLSLELLATGESAFRGVRDYRVSESLANECLKPFCRAIIRKFSGVYLRRPSPSDFSEIERQYARLGFSGCVGCLDCASWYWDACPVAEQGQHKGKDKKPALRMEVICDDRLRIWHIFFGAPGARNDINILNMSPLFQDVRSGNWPVVKPEITLGDLSLDWYYWLTDQIYPRFKIFMTTIGQPLSRKEKLFSSAQEGARKAVERVFGNLFKRFLILRYPARFWYKQDLCDVIGACATLHNMINRSSKQTPTICAMIALLRKIAVSSN